MFSIVEDYLASRYRYIKSCQSLPLYLTACDMPFEQEQDAKSPNFSVFIRHWLFRSVKIGILTVSDGHPLSHDDLHVMGFS